MVYSCSFFMSYSSIDFEVGVQGGGSLLQQDTQVMWRGQISSRGGLSVSLPCLPTFLPQVAGPTVLVEGYEEPCMVRMENLPGTVSCMTLPRAFLHQLFLSCYPKQWWTERRYCMFSACTATEPHGQESCLSRMFRMFRQNLAKTAVSWGYLCNVIVAQQMEAVVNI